MSGLQIFAVPITPIQGSGVTLPRAHPIPVDDLYLLPPLEIFGAVVGEGSGVHIADAIVVPPVPAFGRALQLIDLPAPGLTGRRRGIAQPPVLDAGNRAQAIVEGFRTEQPMGLVEGLAQDDITEGEVGSPPRHRHGAAGRSAGP